LRDIALMVVTVIVLSLVAAGCFIAQFLTVKAAIKRG